jgi:hypothetical protein
MLMEWIRSNPEVPDGAWCKDFGNFKLVGHGETPGSFLARDQPCFGEMIMKPSEGYVGSAAITPSIHPRLLQAVPR